MAINSIKNRVLPTEVLSLSKANSSYGNRNRVAQKLSNLMKKNLQKVPKKELTVAKYRDILYSLIYPAKPNIAVLPTPKNQDYAGRMTTIDIPTKIDDNIYYTHTGYKLYLPINKKGIITNKDVVVHESRHLFDYLCNPKYASPRLSYLTKDENEKQKLEKTLDYLTYKQFFNIPLLENFELSIYKKKAIKLLESYSNTDKIRILQQVRYYIASELNAYTDVEADRETYLVNDASGIHTLRLYEKRFFIEEQLKKALKKERGLM